MRPGRDGAGQHLGGAHAGGKVATAGEGGCQEARPSYGRSAHLGIKYSGLTVVIILRISIATLLSRFGKPSLTNTAA